MNRLFLENILLGTILYGRFRLVHLLHASDFVGVYLCADTRARDKLCVLKVYVTRVLREFDMRTGVLHELALAQRIRHPNVVRYEHLFEDDEFTALHMEYCPGGALATQFSANSRFTFEYLIDVLAQLTLGLSAVHKARILHRDIKPENILTADRGVLKLSDFGIARMQGDDLDPLQEMVPGTVHYMSPESVARGEFSPASDMYALGVLAYRLLTGRFPFEGEDLVEILAARVLKDPPEVRQFRADCPAQLEAIVMKTIARHPSARYSNCTELLREITALGNGLGERAERLVA